MGASYQPPSADGARAGIFYINTHNLRGQPLYSRATLALHEAAPAHHYQFAIQQEQLPRFQRFNSFKAYVEGWALYAESLGHELGLYRDLMQHYAHLNDEMLRDGALPLLAGKIEHWLARQRQFARSDQPSAEVRRPR